MENRDETYWSSRRSTKGTRRPSYSRRIKPPLSYTELIRQAILASPERALTLRQIVACLRNGFPCFRGPYQGWRNSVRHNLSASNCFVKILRDFNKPNGKDNFWILNENCKCSQCMKGVNQSVCVVGLSPFIGDFSNFRPVQDMAQFRQIPEFPAIVESPDRSESADVKLTTADPGPPLQTDIDQVLINAEESNEDSATANGNNNGAAELCQSGDGHAPLEVDSKDEAASNSSSMVELKRPEEYAIEYCPEGKNVLSCTMNSQDSEEKDKWHEMTFTKLEDLNFVQPLTQSTHDKKEHHVNWSKVPHQYPSHFMATHYLQQAQYSYPYPPFNPHGYSADDRSYYSVPPQEYPVAPTSYWMGNYGDPYHQATQNTANEQWHQYQRVNEHSGHYWTHL